MPEVDPVLAALQSKIDEQLPPELPLYLGRTSSAVVVAGPKLRFVLTATVVHHELDLDWATVSQLYQSVREVLGDAVTTAEDQAREQIADLEHQIAQLTIERDSLLSQKKDT